MPYKNGLFHHWVPKPIGILVLFIILLPLLTVNGVYTTNLPDLVGSLGSLSEDITFASYASSVGQLAAFPIFTRLRQYIKSRNILIASLLALVIISLVCANTSSVAVLVLGNFLMGAIKLIALVEIAFPMIAILTPSGNRGLFYSLFYPLSIACGAASGLLTAQLAYAYNWQYVYYFSIPLLLIALTLVLVLFHSQRTSRKIPLYQVDWLSMALFSSILMLINYICVYGRVEDWFGSVRIQAASVSLPILLVWFIKRQFNRKRPYMTFDVLQYRNVRIALLLIFFMQILLNSGIIQSAFTTTVIKLDVPNNAILSLWMIPGVLAGAVLCYIWFQKKKPYKAIILLGFTALVLYHLILLNRFYAETGIQDLYLAMVLKGFGQVTLYIGLGVTIIYRLPMNSFLASSLFLVMLRSGFGVSVTTAFYSNLLYQKQVQHITGLANNMDALNPLVSARLLGPYQAAITQGKSVEDAQVLASLSINGTVQVQSLMLAAREIYGYVVAAGVLILLLIIFIRLQPPGNGMVKWRRRIISNW